MCEAFAGEGISVKYEPVNVSQVIPKDVALCIYRVIQESLRNIAKHAQVKEAEVMLTSKEDCIHLCVRDSGVGFNPVDIHGKAGLGLASMEERVRLIRGELSVKSQSGQGTTIDLEAPLTRRSQ